MMKKIYISICLAILTIFMPLSTLTASAYNPFAGACKQAPNSSTCTEAQQSSGNPIPSTIHTVANLVALGAGIASVIILILAGLTLVTSQGNAEAAARARKRIIYTIVGLVIVAVAWSLVTFVIDRIIK